MRITRRPVGFWVRGSHSDPRGTLFLVPFLQPKRDYQLYVPAGYHRGNAIPLVVMLHGCKQDPITFAEGTGMNQLADRFGFLVLYPEQRRFANSWYCWNWFDSSVQHGGGEAALIVGMVQKICTEYTIDTQRVYVAGLSAGGAMTSILASCYGKLFAACAVHSGFMFRAADSVSDVSDVAKRGARVAPEEAARQASQQKDFAFVPAIVIQGSKDEVVDVVNAGQVVEQFVAMAKHDDKAEFTATSQKVIPSDGYHYEIEDHVRGGQVLVRKIVVEDMGHAWSGGNPKHLFNDPKGPDASRMIWEFVSSFRREPALVAAPLASSSVGARA
jgi:poly(hydroxyalkanoate) depolymerase family esterase